MLKDKIVAMTFNLGCSSITKCDVKVNPSYNYLATKLFMEDGEEVDILPPKAWVPSLDQSLADKEVIVQYAVPERDIKLTGKINFEQGTIEILGEGFKEVEITAFDKKIESPDESVTEVHSVAVDKLLDEM